MIPAVYAVVKWLHVLLAIAALGATITYGTWLRRSVRDPAHLAHVLRTIKFIDNRMALPAYGLVLLTGIGLVGLKPELQTQPWLLISIALYVVAMAISLGLIRPGWQRQIEAVERSGADSEAYRIAAAQGRPLVLIVVLIVVVIVFLMVTKPGFGLAP